MTPQQEFLMKSSILGGEGGNMIDLKLVRSTIREGLDKVNFGVG